MWNKQLSCADAQYCLTALLEGSLGQQRNTVLFEVLQPPTVTPAGDFLLTLRNDEETNLADWTLLCTVDAVERVKVAFEGKLQPESGNKGWRVVIQADVLPESIFRLNVTFH